VTPVHLLTTDTSGFDLVARVPDLKVVAASVPENRLGQPKLDAVYHRAAALGVPVSVHRRGARLPGENGHGQVVLSWFYSQIILPEDISRYSLGMLNMHGGRIPDYRGSNVLQWAIINGEDQIWVTWHQIVSEVDAGPIWAETPLALPLSWTAREAREAIVAAGLTLFPEAWRRFRSGETPIRVPRPDEGRIWPPRRPRDGRIEFGWSERRLRDLVRALCPPWPRPTIETSEGERVVLGIDDEPGAGRIRYTCASGSVVHLVLAPR
jgi:methionyl-tRNA formyltransferase